MKKLNISPPGTLSTRHRFACTRAARRYGESSLCASVVYHSNQSIGSYNWGSAVRESADSRAEIWSRSSAGFSELDPVLPAM